MHFRAAPRLRRTRKPIYDDPHPPPRTTHPSPPEPKTPPTDDSISPPSEPEVPRGPTPTDRLTVQIRHARLALYNHALTAEKSLNQFMKSAFALERDFTQTVASLAPPETSNENVVPGVIYILVATLAGSIVTRSRGIVLRTTVPIAFGTTAAYAALPVTMGNVESLYRRYESRYPEVQRMHRRMNEQASYVFETGKAHSAMTISRGEEFLGEARRKMEEWVRQGK
ncbi:MAG: hypothetical protein Q9162_003780 [Coniocarpon cinnabarinum]